MSNKKTHSLFIKKQWQSLRLKGHFQNYLTVIFFHTYMCSLPMYTDCKFKIEYYSPNSSFIQIVSNAFFLSYANYDI